jgi:DNA-directed RNA polymerase subunit N (RpoN/RPB10)
MKIYMKSRRKPPLPDLRVQRYCINRIIVSENSSLTQHLQYYELVNYYFF